jgi:uncharacterized membrane protein
VLPASDEGAVVVLAIYSVKDEAEMALNGLVSRRKKGVVEFTEAATVFRNRDGKIYITNESQTGSGEGVYRGHANSSVVGLIFSPSIVVGPSIREAASDPYRQVRERRTNGDALERAGDSLLPGQTGLIAAMKGTSTGEARRCLSASISIDTYPLDSHTSAMLLRTHNESTSSLGMKELDLPTSPPGPEDDSDHRRTY